MASSHIAAPELVTHNKAVIASCLHRNCRLKLTLDDSVTFSQLMPTYINVKCGVLGFIVCCFF